MPQLSLGRGKVPFIAVRGAVLEAMDFRHKNCAITLLLPPNVEPGAMGEGIRADHVRLLSILLGSAMNPAVHVGFDE